MAQFTIPLYIDRKGRVRKSASFPEFYNNRDNKLALKRKDVVTLALYFLDDNLNTYLLDVGTPVTVGVKANGRFDDSSYLASGVTTDQPATSSDPYLVELPLTAPEIDSLLNVDSDLENDIASVDTIFEISWLEVDGKPNSTIDPLGLTIYNDIIREGDVVGSNPSSNLGLVQKVVDAFEIDEDSTMYREYVWPDMFSIVEGDLLSLRVTVMIRSLFKDTITNEAREFSCSMVTHVSVHKDTGYATSYSSPTEFLFAPEFYSNKKNPDGSDIAPDNSENFTIEMQDESYQNFPDKESASLTIQSVSNAATPRSQKASVHVIIEKLAISNHLTANFQS